MPPESEAQSWWADVQHVRESIERRRAAAGSSAGAEGPVETRFARAADSLPVIDDLDWTSAHSGAHFDQAGRPPRPDRARPRPRRAGDGRGDAAFDRSEPRDRRRPADRREGREHPAGRRERDMPATAAAIDRDAHDDVSDVRSVSPDAGATTPTAVPATTALGPPPARRTVQITGRTVAAPPLPRLVEVERRRPGRRPLERLGPRPDRIALYAVLLGFFLILVAATSSHT